MPDPKEVAFIAGDWFAIYSTVCSVPVVATSSCASEYGSFAFNGVPVIKDPYLPEGSMFMLGGGVVLENVATPPKPPIKPFISPLPRPGEPTRAIKLQDDDPCESY